MKIAIGADHRGAAAAKVVLEKAARDGHDARIVGVCSGEVCDYPENAALVGQGVAEGAFDIGILICGTGIGMCMAANKIKGVRAATVHDEFTAEISRRHNDANILCLSADLLGHKLMEKIVEVWLRTPFDGGRHARRLRKISAIEEGRDPATVRD